MAETYLQSLGGVSSLEVSIYLMRDTTTSLNIKHLSRLMGMWVGGWGSRRFC